MGTELNGLFHSLQNKIPFTMVDVDEQKPSDFENMSPLGSVPLLQDGDLNIYRRYIISILPVKRAVTMYDLLT